MLLNQDEAQALNTQEMRVAFGADVAQAIAALASHLTRTIPLPNWWLFEGPGGPEILCLSEDRFIHVTRADGVFRSAAFRASELQTVTAIDVSDKDAYTSIEWWPAAWRLEFTNRSAIEILGNGRSQRDRLAEFVRSLPL